MKNIRRIVSIFFLLITGSIFFGSSSARANQVLHIPQIMGRGVLNLVSFPLEVVRTPAVETGAHHYLWIFSSVPRTFRNVIYRLSSGLYDIAFYPFATPFVEEAPPFTQKMGLSNYIWQNADDY